MTEHVAVGTISNPEVLIAAWWPREAGNAVRLALTAIAAIYLSMLIELDSPEWAGWTVLSVSLATRANSLQKSIWRGISSVIGAIVAIVLVDAFAQDTLAFDVGLALWLALVTAMSSIVRGQDSYGFALMGYTVAIVTLDDVQNPLSVFDVAVDRCSTLLLGVACAYVSNALVARGVGTVAKSLGERLETTVVSCAAWLRRADEGDGHAGDAHEGEAMPVGAVLALNGAITDAFTEQRSLKTGGRAFADAPIRLLRMIAVGALRSRLAIASDAEAQALLGFPASETDRDLRRLRAVNRLLRMGGRADTHYAPARPLAADWDGRRAAKDALRTILAVSLPNAFWYLSGWVTGGAMVTWAALVSVLFASRPDNAAASLDFMIGAAFAALVGLVAHYTILTTTGVFLQLAAVLLPIGMLMAMGRYDKRAKLGAGYGLVVLTFVGPKNVMVFDLGSSVNGALADLLGMGVATIAFAALVTQGSQATIRARAMRRMARAVGATAWVPAFVLPSDDRWLARMFDRLNLLRQKDADEDAGAEQTLLLVGLLLRALRRRDDRFGREVAGIVCAQGPDACASLDAWVTADRPASQRKQLATIAGLLRQVEARAWREVMRG